MSFLEALAAVILITSPQPLVVKEALLPSKEAVYEAALYLEIISDFEKPAWNLDSDLASTHATFASTITDLRYRYNYLKDFPRVEECARLPSWVVCENFLMENSTYQKSLCERQKYDVLHASELDAAIKETKALSLFWKTLHTAQTTHYTINIRRDALNRVRELSGTSAFYRGELPPHLPLWRLTKE